MSEYIRKLIAQGEHQQLDFKFEISDSKKIARTLVAFANTDGGRLLVGVKDNGAIAGVRSEEEYYMIEAAAQLFCKPEIVFQTKEWDVDGKLVLEVFVPKSRNLKHKAPAKENDYKVFVRVKDQNILADPILLQYWKLEQSDNVVNINFTEPEMLLLQYVDQHGSISRNELMNTAGIGKKQAERMILNFMLMGILELKLTERETRFVLVSHDILKSIATHFK